MPGDQPADREQAARAIDAFLRALGRDPAREPELVGTGARVAQAFADDLCKGYGLDVPGLFAKNVMHAGAGRTQIVALRDIEVATTCPHHLMPALGLATVAFAPGARLIGLGAIAELVEAFSRRLILQEKIGDLVVGALMEHLEPAWAGCRMVLMHTCLSARGERKEAARTETVALSGPSHEDDRRAAMLALGVGH
jgi:GTP cyclohydrolase I